MIAGAAMISNAAWTESGIALERIVDPEYEHMCDSSVRAITLIASGEAR
jgi:hypothetical protein